MTELVPDTDRRAATRELLTGLRGVKRWFHESSRTLHPSHASAAVAVLGLLEAAGPARISELAELAHVDVSVVSRQLHDLEAAGLVERRRDPSDGRAQLVTPTARGVEVLEEARTEIETRVAERLDGWSAEQLADLAATLRRLLGDLGS